MALKIGETRAYCQDCFEFLLFNRDSKEHFNHKLLQNITQNMMERPILEILDPLISNSFNAQFIFDQKTAQFILDCIKNFSYDSLLCVGCPSIFERSSELKVNRLLLDIDQRFAQFYDENEFIKFNMFNAHFFAHKTNYLEFLNNSKNILLVIDPPYGGIVQLIANTIKSIKKDFFTNNEKKMTIFLIYPYFMRGWIENWLPEFKMLDYKVSYANQEKFSCEKNFKKGSPARIYTNVSPKQIKLPEEEGYFYCSSCEKFTYAENFHCDKCNSCTSKDGGYYKHCNDCQRCVKVSYDHCYICKLCHLEKDCKNERLKMELYSRKKLKKR